MVSWRVGENIFKFKTLKGFLKLNNNKTNHLIKMGKRDKHLNKEDMFVKHLKYAQKHFSLGRFKLGNNKIPV